MKKKKSKWKYQINFKKKILVSVILGVFLFIGLGYSFLGSNFLIGGTLEVKKYEKKELYSVFEKEYANGYVRKYDGEHQDSMDLSKSTENIYHWYGGSSSVGNEIREKNNVVFANHCWQMVRTTDTGGVKLLYNGEPETTVVDGVVQYNCGETRYSYHLGTVTGTQNISGTKTFYKDYTVSSNGYTFVDDPDDPDDTYTVTINNSNAKTVFEYVAENYPYVCSSNSTTCTTVGLYKVIGWDSAMTAKIYKATYRDAIGTGAYHGDNRDSAASVGYMYGDSYVFGSLSPTTTANLSTTYTFSLSGVSASNGYYYADTYDWNITNSNKYTLLEPKQIDENTDFSGLAGKYLIMNSTSYTNSTIYYIVNATSTSATVYRLSNGAEPLTFRFADSLDSDLQTLSNPTGIIELKDYYQNYANYIGKYTCGDSSITCTNPRYITTTTNKSYTYVSGNFLLAEERNGLDLTVGNYVTIDAGKWYNGYNTTYANYVYTCGNADTVCAAADLKYIKSRTSTGYTYLKNYNYGTNVIYEDNVFKLQNVQGLETVNDATLFSTHHYSCPEVGATECANAIYIIYSNSSDTTHYVTVSDPNAKSISDILTAMFTKNTNDSLAKEYVDLWYELKIKDTPYELKLEDVIYCNDRSYSTTNGNRLEDTAWYANGNITNAQLSFKGYNSSLICSNVADQFSVSNNSAKLKYPIGLLNTKEIDISYGSSGIFKSSHEYWLMTPFYFNSRASYLYGRSYVGMVHRSGSTGSYSFEKGSSSIYPLSYRPAIALKKGTTYIRGDGKTDNPYVVDSDVRVNNWKNTQLSGTRITANGGTTTISSIGSTTNGNQLSKMEYYTTCSSGTATGSVDDPQIADIVSNSATININACSGATLYYRLKDTAGISSDGWNKIDNIAEYMLYGSVYNNMTYAGGVASNDYENLTYWVNTNDYNNIAHKLIAMSYYDDDSKETVEALDTTTLVERTYPTFFGRDADNTKDSWINAINNNSETIESFFLNFINSSEAKNIRSAWGLDNSEYHP